MNEHSRKPHLLIVLLLVIAFSLSTRLFTIQMAGEEVKSSQSLIVMLLGDSRRLFANQFFVKADEYFHAGYYPSIFDQAAVARKGGGSAVATGAVTGDAHAGEVEWMHAPKDWIERFSRNFFPSEHIHLDADSHDHDGDGKPDHAADEHLEHDHDGDGVADHDADHHDDHEVMESTQMREILPWLRISAELDPNREETYLTGSYWLRTRMDSVAEAEEFIRDGLRANPKSYALTYELARIFEENHQDQERARNLYLLALRYWNNSQRLAPEPDRFMHAQILMQLAMLERHEGNREKAVGYLRELQEFSPNASGIDKLILDIEAGEPPK